MEIFNRSGKKSDILIILPIPFLIHCSIPLFLILLFLMYSRALGNFITALTSGDWDYITDMFTSMNETLMVIILAVRRSSSIHALEVKEPLEDRRTSSFSSAISQRKG